MGYKCPKCGTKNIRIMATISVQPIPGGYEAMDVAEWDENSGAYCLGCDFSGNVDQFEAPDADAIQGEA